MFWKGNLKYNQSLMNPILNIQVKLVGKNRHRSKFSLPHSLNKMLTSILSLPLCLSHILTLSLSCPFLSFLAGSQILAGACYRHKRLHKNIVVVVVRMQPKKYQMLSQIYLALAYDTVISGFNDLLSIQNIFRFLNGQAQQQVFIHILTFPGDAIPPKNDGLHLIKDHLR